MPRRKAAASRRFEHRPPAPNRLPLEADRQEQKAGEEPVEHAGRDVEHDAARQGEQEEEEAGDRDRPAEPVAQIARLLQGVGDQVDAHEIDQDEAEQAELHHHPAALVFEALSLEPALGRDIVDEGRRRLVRGADPDTDEAGVLEGPIGLDQRGEEPAGRVGGGAGTAVERLDHLRGGRADDDSQQRDDEHDPHQHGGASSISGDRQPPVERRGDQKHVDRATRAGGQHADQGQAEGGVEQDVALELPPDGGEQAEQEQDLGEQVGGEAGDEGKRGGHAHIGAAAEAQGRGPAGPSVGVDRARRGAHELEQCQEPQGDGQQAVEVEEAPELLARLEGRRHHPDHGNVEEVGLPAEQTHPEVRQVRVEHLEQADQGPERQRHVEQRRSHHPQVPSDPVVQEARVDRQQHAVLGEVDHLLGARHHPLAQGALEHQENEDEAAPPGAT